MMRAGHHVFGPYILVVIAVFVVSPRIKVRVKLLLQGSHTVRGDGGMFDARPNYLGAVDFMDIRR